MCVCYPLLNCGSELTCWPSGWAVTCQVAPGQPLGTLHTRCRLSVSQSGDGDYGPGPRPLNSRASHNVGIMTPSWSPEMRCRWLLITITHKKRTLNWHFNSNIWMNDVKEVCKIWFHHLDNRPLYCEPVFRWPQMAGLLSGLIGINESRTDHHHSGTPVPSLVTRCLCKHGH